MCKKTERAIPYRVYKRLFPDCKAHDYSNGKITVEFPEDYLVSKMYIPDGWSRGGNWVGCSAGKTTSGYEVGINISEHSDGGCKYYDAYVTVGNVFAGGTQKSKCYNRNFQAAFDWATETAEKIINT